MGGEQERAGTGRIPLPSSAHAFTYPKDERIALGGYKVQPPAAPLGRRAQAPTDGQQGFAHLRLGQAIVDGGEGREQGIVVGGDLGASARGPLA